MRCAQCVQPVPKCAGTRRSSPHFQRPARRAGSMGYPHSTVQCARLRIRTRNLPKLRIRVWIQAKLQLSTLSGAPGKRSRLLPLRSGGGLNATRAALVALGRFELAGLGGLKVTRAALAAPGRVGLAGSGRLNVTRAALAAPGRVGLAGSGRLNVTRAALVAPGRVGLAGSGGLNVTRAAGTGAGAGRQMTPSAAAASQKRRTHRK